MHYVPYLEGRFHTASPDSQGVPSGAILQFLTELDRLDVDLHSLYIFRNGFQLLGANRRPYQGDTPRRIYSAAKALTGLAVLFAIQEGLVSLKTRLTQLFPEDLPETVTPRMESITAPTASAPFWRSLWTLNPAPIFSTTTVSPTSWA